MIKINILRDGVLTNSAQFETQELLDNWYGTHVESFGEHEAVITDIAAKVEQEKVNAEALAFLHKTDYLIIREIETGLLCPEEIKVQRQAARDSIVKL